jgi:SH3 domain protein
MALHRAGGLILLISMLLGSAGAWAADDNVRYVSDQLRIEVREGPGLDYPVLTTLLTGARFAVVEESEDWLRVRWEGGEGWLRRQYTVGEPVAQLRVPELEAAAKSAAAQAEALAAELAPVREALAAAEASGAALAEELATQGAAYAALQAAAGNALETEAALEALKARAGELETVQARLIQDKLALEANQEVEGLKWGGLLALGGVLLGFFLGRAGRRQSSGWV